MKVNQAWVDNTVGLDYGSCGLTGKLADLRNLLSLHRDKAIGNDFIRSNYSSVQNQDLLRLCLC